MLGTGPSSPPPEKFLHGQAHVLRDLPVPDQSNQRIADVYEAMLTERSPLLDAAEVDPNRTAIGPMARTFLLRETRSFMLASAFHF